MRNQYPRLRDAQRHPGPFATRGRAPRRPPERRAAFAIIVATLCAGVFAVTWIATPDLQRLWASTGSSPQEIAAVEHSVYYSGCDQARAAGAAPLHRGTPGYRSEMDGDSDGIACEGSSYGSGGGSYHSRWGRSRRRH